MTKERKVAIEQWQTIRRWIEETPDCIVMIKPLVSYEWKHNCWFCQYVRDYNDDALCIYEGCKQCPLNKWALNKGIIKSHNDFGCLHDKRTLYSMVCNPRYSLEERLEACDLIIKAPKGEHIWEKE